MIHSYQLLIDLLLQNAGLCSLTYESLVLTCSLDGTERAANVGRHGWNVRQYHPKYFVRQDVLYCARTSSENSM